MILLVKSQAQDPGGDGVGPQDSGPPENFPLSWLWSAPWLERSWALTDLGSPVVKLKGATGAGQAPAAHRWSDSPTLDGSAWDGVRVERGSVFLMLWVRGSTSADFLSEHSAFMSALDPKQESLIRVTRPDGLWREIGCRYAEGADLTIDIDPVASGSARYGITWATADPFWRGPEIVASFPYVAPQSFFPGPPWDLAPNRSLSSARIANPGDVDSFPVWRVDGPAVSFSVGVGDAVVDFGAALTVGQWVEIDMSPGKKTIIDHTGADRWDSVTDWNDSPIPPGKSDLVTSLVTAGAGSNATLTFTPRYRAAW